MGFLPSRNAANFGLYVIQQMTWVLFVVPFYLLVKDRYESDEHKELNQSLDWFPLALLASHICTRVMIVAIRYGTTHTISLNTMRKG